MSDKLNDLGAVHARASAVADALTSHMNSTRVHRRSSEGHDIFLEVSLPEGAVKDGIREAYLEGHGDGVDYGRRMPESRSRRERNKDFNDGYANGKADGDALGATVDPGQAQRIHNAAYDEGLEHGKMLPDARSRRAEVHDYTRGYQDGVCAAMGAQPSMEFHNCDFTMGEGGVEIGPDALKPGQLLYNTELPEPVTFREGDTMGITVGVDVGKPGSEKTVITQSFDLPSGDRCMRVVMECSPGEGTPTMTVETFTENPDGTIDEFVTIPERVWDLIESAFSCDVDDGEYDDLDMAIQNTIDFLKAKQEDPAKDVLHWQGKRIIKWWWNWNFRDFGDGSPHCKRAMLELDAGDGLAPLFCSVDRGEWLRANGDFIQFHHGPVQRLHDEATSERQYGLASEAARALGQAQEETRSARAALEEPGDHEAALAHIEGERDRWRRTAGAFQQEAESATRERDEARRTSESLATAHAAVVNESRQHAQEASDLGNLAGNRAMRMHTGAQDLEAAIRYLEADQPNAAKTLVRRTICILREDGDAADDLLEAEETRAFLAAS